MNIKQAKKLFTKYINDECSIEEIQLLEAFLDSYQDKNNIWTELKMGKENVFKIESWSRIESQINKAQKKKGNLFRPYLKYVAAAVLIGILATSYFIRDKFVNNDIENTTPTIVNTNIIVPGTDKATLTLEDGSQVALGKGSSFQTQNASSNGEEIIYEVAKQNAKEVVYNYLTIPRGGQFFVKLSDGTKVWLNSESQLKFPVSFIDGETRNVELVYGEAYFDVSSSSEHKGSKFKVFNQSQEIEVFGTEFNIKAYKDETNVYTTLVEGKIEVNTSIDKQLLVPNQQSNVDVINNKLSVAVVDINTEISWKNGVFIFKEKPLKNIMKVISRWYDIDVVFVNKELEDIRFKGVLGKDQNIEEILSAIKTLSIIKDYKIKDKTIILK
ncbi:FecR family protein [Flavivirga spongiicola]|uniref:FecR family protein n=1 Tax=Flavivirga spongiicola TaxID=421621 RepID=A0ABU7XVP4_9FLAO|nr:FecR family protein [Flavivirga sp. MEBiC05379]MDO5979837.1 FecR family protein [Flavivirga sp. MEBiC05379]